MKIHNKNVLNYDLECKMKLKLDYKIIESDTYCDDDYEMIVYDNIMIENQGSHGNAITFSWFYDPDIIWIYLNQKKKIATN